jgi:hypothetical protein
MRGRTFVVAATLSGVTICGIAAPRSTTFSSKLRASDGETIPLHETPLDLRGNEVRPAVARYKVDFTGALYEEHSPESEVPRLAPPEG